MPKDHVVLEGDNFLTVVINEKTKKNKRNVLK